MTRSAMLLPKPRRRRGQVDIPTMGEWQLSRFFADLTPAERHLLRWIADNADLIEVDGGPDHLLVPMPRQMLDQLAEFEADREDREPAMEDEDGDPGEEDDPPEDEGDREIGNEHDLAALRRLHEQRYRQDVKRMLGIDLDAGPIALRLVDGRIEPYPVEGVPR